MITQRLDDRDQFATDMERLDDKAVNRYAHLIGLIYPDEHGRPITVLDVDEWGTALMERGGEYWGCGAEYLTDLLPAPVSTPAAELFACSICGEEFNVGFGTVADGFATCHECENENEFDAMHYGG